MMDKTKEKVAHTPAVGVAGEQPSYMYNNTIIADAVDYVVLCQDLVQVKMRNFSPF